MESSSKVLKLKSCIVILRRLNGHDFLIAFFYLYFLVKILVLMVNCQSSARRSKNKKSSYAITVALMASFTILIILHSCAIHKWSLPLIPNGLLQHSLSSIILPIFNLLLSNIVTACKAINLFYWWLMFYIYCSGKREEEKE